MDVFRRRGPARAAQWLAAAAALWSVAAAADPVARDDRGLTEENDAMIVDVLANDVFDAAALADGELVISSPPQGTASVDTRGTADASDDRIAYAPPGDFSGDDVLSYQVCEDDGACAEAQLHVVVRPHDDVNLESATGAGFRDIEMHGLRDLPDVMFRTTPLVPAKIDTPALAVDPTPEDPWNDGGTAVVSHRLPQPANGLPQRWRVLVDARGADGDVDLYLGVDANGDQQPDPGEIACTAAMTTGVERCEVEITHPGVGDVDWWLVVHNRHGAAQSARAESFEVPFMGLYGESFVATGPGDVPPLIDFTVRVAYDASTAIAGEARAGYVSVVSEGTSIGEFPVRIDRTSDQAAARMLGLSPQTVRLAAMAQHDRLFIDVPAGATELRVVSSADGNIDLYLVKSLGESSPDVGSSPPSSAAQASSTGPTGSESAVVAAPVPGRWFVRVHNLDDATVQASVQAFVTATAPVVRPGSYFDPVRSGHGTFLYPAADQRTGLWYTYFQDRTPTWYYLQAQQPGANGIWSSELYRAAWDGDSRELVVVGRVVMTPIAPDRFIWSFRIDGETGSETMQALGRGCPLLDGDVVDASSTWFDPDHDGTGYSVQYWPSYEYYAAFVYDALGVPRFLTAERTGFGDADEILDLEQLRGFCPLCERTGAPEREDIGIFARGFDDDAMLELMAAIGVYTDGVPGEWSSEDDVQLLGGPGTTQGCQP